MLLEVLQAFSSQWESDTWHLAVTGPLAYLFDLPKSQLAADEDESAVVSFVWLSGKKSTAQFCVVAESQPALTQSSRTTVLQQ